MFSDPRIKRKSIIDIMLLSIVLIILGILMGFMACEQISDKKTTTEVVAMGIFFLAAYGLVLSSAIRSLGCWRVAEPSAEWITNNEEEL